MLKYILYIEVFLMAMAVITGCFMPEFFLSQITSEPPTPLTIALAQWYGVAFVALTVALFLSIRSGSVIFLRGMMISFLPGDTFVFIFSFIIASSIGWSTTFIISAVTAVIFFITRVVVIKNPEWVDKSFAPANQP